VILEAPQLPWRSPREPAPPTTARRVLRPLLAAAVALGLSLAPLPVRAAGPSVKEQVDALNARAIEKFQAKEYDAAVALFEEAYALQPEPNYLFNIGRIYEESGNLEQSVEFYERFVKQPGVPLDARERGLERLRVLRAILEETAPRQPKPDESEPEPEPEPLAQPEPEPPAQPEDQKPPKLRIAGYAVLGTGGALLVTGGVMAGLALGRANALEDQHTLEERRDTADRGRSMALTADILFGVGGAAAVAGLVMVLVTREKKPTAAARAGITPWATRRGTGVAATLRF
jgi:tetratricopeptide (TPR) repeat protein